MPDRPAAELMGGIPSQNLALYHKIRFQAGDPAAFVRTASGTHLIIRDIEADRARAHAAVDRVWTPSDLAPSGGLSADRETATAQAAAELLRREGETRARSDRTMNLLFMETVTGAGIDVDYDPDLGVLERRSKAAQELDALREAQRATEGAIRTACETIARATARADGVLEHDGGELTSERVRAMIDVYLLERGYENPACIVAGGVHGGDCHERGSGPLRTGQAVVIDVFPKNRESLYNGDCTRCVVHGDIPDEIERMHAAVVKAKGAAIAATRAGVSGEDVHRATMRSLDDDGFRFARPDEVERDDEAAMVHGTGHGIGLEVHEAPLLDLGAPALVVGDVVTIEPGLYRRDLGGIRIEDMLAVTETGSENFNTLPEGLDWS